MPRRAAAAYPTHFQAAIILAFPKTDGAANPGPSPCKGGMHAKTRLFEIFRRDNTGRLDRLSRGASPRIDREGRRSRRQNRPARTWCCDHPLSAVSALGARSERTRRAQAKDGQRKVEIIEYDDRMQPPEAIKALERLATVDKADWISGVYATGFNLATAPTFDKYKYPQVSVACITDQAPALVKKYPNFSCSTRRRRTTPRARSAYLRSSRTLARSATRSLSSMWATTSASNSPTPDGRCSRRRVRRRL